MHKTFFILFFLLLPTILVNGEDDPLIRLAQMYNQEQSPVYRIDFIVIKNLIIDDIDKEEKWPELNELILNNNGQAIYRKNGEIRKEAEEKFALLNYRFR